MLTKEDRKQLIKDFKEVFPTKADIKRLPTRNELDQKLAKQATDIILGVGEFIHDNVLPLFTSLEKRIERVEKRLGINTPS